MKNFLLYLALVLLIGLLFLPMGLRSFAKDAYPEKEEKKEETVVEYINCNKMNENFYLVYMNGTAYNLFYTVKGNYTIEQIKEDDPNTFIKDISGIATSTYNEVDDTTKFTVEIYTLETIPEELSAYVKDITTEMDFLSQSGFSCSKN